jgi:hypothetical protein
MSVPLKERVVGHTAKGANASKLAVATHGCDQGKRSAARLARRVAEFNAVLALTPYQQKLALYEVRRNYVLATTVATLSAPESKIV